MPDQTALDWIEVHVVKFFVSLLATPYVEVVKTGLPEMRSANRRIILPESKLRTGFHDSTTAPELP